MTNLEVMLAGRPDIKAQIAGLAAGDMMPFALAMQWMEALAGTSSSMHEISKVQAGRIRELEAQVATLEDRNLVHVSVKVADLPVALKAIELADAALNALRDFVAWHGPAHEINCPEDDTCDCRGRELNARVNRVLEDAKALADQHQPASHPEDCTGCAVWETRGE